jgi:dolichol-phosphate mannosyltransferase
MIVYVRSKLARVLKIDFVRFCIVGGTGFVINSVILIVLTHFFNINILIAQLVGAEVALFSNFILHHNWTYKENKVHKSMKSLILQFHATTWPAIVGSALMVSAGVSLLHMNKLEALVISSVVALAWNYSWSKYVIWRDVTEKEIKEIVS